MATNSQLSITESKKNKPSKQAEQKQNHRCGDHLAGYQPWGGMGWMGKDIGINKHKLGGTK